MSGGASWLAQDLAIVSDAIVAVAGVLASWAALSGLKVWRRQLKGTSQHQAAIGLLKAIYMLRAAVDPLRIPAWGGRELDPNKHRTARDDAAEMDQVFSERVKPIVEAIAALDTSLIEAQVFWGDGIGATVRPIRTRVWQLVYIDLPAYIQQVRLGERADRKFTEKLYAIVFRPSITGGRDEWLEGLEADIKIAVDLLRPHVK